MACMTYYPRACGSLKVNAVVFPFLLLLKVKQCSGKLYIHYIHLFLQEKLGVYFMSKMDSDNPKVQEVSGNTV